MGAPSNLDRSDSSQPAGQSYTTRRRMCLIVLAHRTSEDFPLVVAANRDEDYDR
ncbi:MAG TPA: NRDE family protein, partial [Thermoanaerobaculia bacterium]